MSGQLLVQPAGAPDERHLRVRARSLHDGLELRFVDQRMFGGLSVSDGGAELPAEIAHIARDPLDPEFDEDAFVRRVRRRTAGREAAAARPDARVRRRQHLRRRGAVAGPPARRPAGRPAAPARRSRELLGHARAVMTEALGEGGTSFDALYVNVNGESGYFDRSLRRLRPRGRALRALRDRRSAGSPS